MRSFYFYTGYGLLRYMFADNWVTRDELYATGPPSPWWRGGTYLYVAVQFIWPNSFTIYGEADPGTRTWFELLYLSITTMTSTGLSDIIAVTPHARSFVLLQQISRHALCRARGRPPRRPHHRPLPPVARDPSGGYLAGMPLGSLPSDVPPALVGWGSAVELGDRRDARGPSRLQVTGDRLDVAHDPQRVAAHEPPEVGVGPARSMSAATRRGYPLTSSRPRG